MIRGEMLSVIMSAITAKKLFIYEHPDRSRFKVESQKCVDSWTVRW